MKEKTIIEWLKELPDGYRERALRNFDPSYYNAEYHSIGGLSDSILEAFYWGGSPEGHEFWEAVYGWAYEDSELPPLPQETRWVRVEDGLPTHSRVVLLTDGRWRTVGFNNGDSWMVYEDEPMDMEYSTFTHWMEYPELPEEEK